MAAQQPLLPGLEPSAHFAAEAQAAAKTSTRSVASERGDMLVLRPCAWVPISSSDDQGGETNGIIKASIRLLGIGDGCLCSRTTRTGVLANPGI